jgi:hypothetical protein
LPDALGQENREIQLMESGLNQYVFCSTFATTAGEFTALTDGCGVSGPQSQF